MIPKGKVEKNDLGLSNIDYDGRRVAVIAAVSIHIPAGKAADVGKVLILVHSADVQQNADQTGIAQRSHRTEQHSTAQHSAAQHTLRHPGIVCTDCLPLPLKSKRKGR